MTARFAQPPLWTMNEILAGELNACAGELELVRGYREIGEAWAIAPVGASGNPDQRSLWWWIDAFHQDTEEKARIARAQREQTQVFLDLARLTNVVTGRPGKVPWRLVDTLHRRTLRAQFPSARDVAILARVGPPARAREALLRHIPPGAWARRA